MLARISIATLTLCLLLALLAFVATAAPAARVLDSGPVPPAAPLSAADQERAASKMDGELRAQLQGDASIFVTAMVEMGERPTLHPAPGAPSGAAVYETLQAQAATRQAGVQALLEVGVQQGEVARYRSHIAFNGLTVKARPDFLYRLALRDDVEAVTANHVYHLDGARGGGMAAPGTAEWNISRIGADAVWAELGVTGEGVLVASLDSGVQYNHPSLSRQYAGNLGSGFDHNFHWFDATLQRRLVPYDDNGHGTHTMGTILGGDGTGPFVNDIGVAPGARWITVKVFDASGGTTSEVIHLAFDWLLAPCPAGILPGDPACDPARAPAVVNNSWGSNDGARVEFLSDVRALRAAGILPVFSAGNNGPGDGTLGAPGSFDEAFSVGATDIDDRIASFSSRGPSPLTDLLKPDVSAPGVAVRSSVPVNQFDSFNGTSMAAPHVAGLAALLLSARPDLDLETMEALIRGTAVDLGDPGPDYVYGAGRIDAFNTVDRAANGGTLRGVVREAGVGEPLPGALVRVQSDVLTLQSLADGSGAFTFTFLSAGVYTVSAELYAFEPLALAGVQVRKDESQDVEIALQSLPWYTISGRVSHALTPTLPISFALISATNTPLPPVLSDLQGSYAISVAAGPVDLRADAFGFASALTGTLVTTDTRIDFQLDPLPPVLLVDDDGGSQFISPQVEEHYFAALDVNGFEYDHWDVDVRGAPGFDTIRQYPAVVWFGGEFGRIRDLSEAEQAQALMDYLDLGGRLLYVSQQHTWYFGDDKACDSAQYGGEGPCPFTHDYLGVADWVEDQLAEINYGVAGDPVGDELGEMVMNYPPRFFDFSDHITGTVSASLAMTAAVPSRPGRLNHTAYTHQDGTRGFKTVFMATPLEAMAPEDAASAMLAVMEWFGVPGRKEGVSIAPARATTSALPGQIAAVKLRLRNFNRDAERYTLSLAPSSWPARLLDPTSGAEIGAIGPVPAGGSADFVAEISVPAGAAPGSAASFTVFAEAQGELPYLALSELHVQAKMSYYVQDSDTCGSGVTFDWVDATGGVQHLLDQSGATPEPEFISVTLPSPFQFYNVTYDHVWINDYGTLIFGDDNVFDDGFPTGTPPIPNITTLDPNAAIYASWGTAFWHPSSQPAEAGVYTWHETGGGRNQFVVQYHRYRVLAGAEDTFQAILDLDSSEIILQYMDVSNDRSTVVGIENQFGDEGILYVNRRTPEENRIHGGLAVKFGPGQPGPARSVALIPTAAVASAPPGGVATYTLTISNTGNITDTYDLAVIDADWSSSLWRADFSQALTRTNALGPCARQDFGLRVEVPEGVLLAEDVMQVRARSQSDPLVAASSAFATSNRGLAVRLRGESVASAPPGRQAIFDVDLTNSGTLSDTYDVELATGAWPAELQPPPTLPGPIDPGNGLPYRVVVSVPATATWGSSDVFTLTARSQTNPEVLARHLGTSYAGARLYLPLYVRP